MPMPTFLSGRPRNRHSVFSHFVSSTSSVVVSQLIRPRSSSAGPSAKAAAKRDTSSSIASDERAAQSDPTLSEPNIPRTGSPVCVITEPCPSCTTINNEPAARVESALPAFGAYIPPLESVVNVAIDVGKLVGSVAPVPGLALAVNLVSNILQMCQNVPKNRNGVTNLAKRCSALLDIVKEKHANSNYSTPEAMRLDLESLLKKIERNMEEWGKLNWFESFAQQDVISKTISSYHAEIDQFCNRHTLAVHIEILNWQQAHDKQVRQDREELKAFLSDLKNTQELENKCRKEEISAMRDDFVAFFAVVQELLLESRRGSMLSGPSKQCESFEDNFSAIYRASGTLPPGMELTIGLIQMKKVPEYGNSVFDIYRGTCFNDVNFQCAFKVVRHVSLGDKTRNRFDRQLKHWQSIQNLAAVARTMQQKIYVLPLIGAIHSESHPYPFLCFVSPWMEKGNALDYVKRTENADRLALIRKVALGLKVLHTHNPPLAHGYIRGSNILIDDMCDPYLSDFGLMRIVEDAKAKSMAPSSLPNTAGSYRWLPPELLGLVGLGESNPDNENYGNDLTTKSDIFMYGMTVLELMTGEYPYSNLKYDNQVILCRDRGEKPKKPVGSEWEKVCRRGLDERLWGLLERCWAQNPADRPTITEVLESLPTSNYA
ncbi:hypothetical protein M0805_005545 [Coniferiporia weirii]|nr:hypothetical protein M0805_005545 [Coniferiporia weirii]